MHRNSALPRFYARIVAPPAAAAAVLLAAGCGLGVQRASAPDGAVLAAGTNTPGSLPILPDPALTPGATLPVTTDDICRPGYTKAVRNVPVDVKQQVYQEYGIQRHARGEFEVDHLISLELGGSNSIKNLWPESYRTQPWNAHVKDQLENQLHDDVCSGQMDLAAAQQEIAGNWIDAYKREFHTSAPLAQSSHRRSGQRGGYAAGVRPAPDEQPDSSASASASGSGSASNASPTISGPTQGQVWVNIRSGKYFYPGAKYYGKTKQGKYMSEAAAQAAGYKAAKSE